MKNRQKIVKNRDKCKFSPQDGALVHFFATRWRFFKKNREKSPKNREKSWKMQVLATRWRFFKKNREKSPKNRKNSWKMQVLATRWRFSSFFRHQMALFFFWKNSSFSRFFFKKTQIIVKNRKKCNFWPPDGAFLRKNREKSPKNATYGHQMAL